MTTLIEQLPASDTKVLVEEALRQGDVASAEAKWDCAGDCYREAVRYLEEKTGVSERDWNSQFPEEDKHLALRCRIGLFNCRMGIVLSGLDMVRPDVTEEASGNVARLEREIGRLRIRNQEHLWARLQEAYDYWREERYRKGWSNEGEVFRFHVYKARMRLYGVRFIRKREPPFPRLRRFVSALGHFLLFAIGRSITLSFVVWVLLPILTFALVYWMSGSLQFIVGGAPVTRNFEGLLYSAYYSFVSFTGLQPAKVEPTIIGLWVSVVQGVVAYTNTIFGIGGIIAARLLPH